MRILLDTHAFLWLISDHENASEVAKSHFVDPGNQLYLSAVSSFEIAVKYSLGKLELTSPPELFVPNRLKANALIPLEITVEQTLVLANLPFHHRDPFDRILVSQAIVENLDLISGDQIFDLYLAEQSVTRIW